MQHDKPGQLRAGRKRRHGNCPNNACQQQLNSGRQSSATTMAAQACTHSRVEPNGRGTIFTVTQHLLHFCFTWKTPQPQGERERECKHTSFGSDGCDDIALLPDHGRQETSRSVHGRRLELENQQHNTDTQHTRLTRVEVLNPLAKKASCVLGMYRRRGSSPPPSYVTPVGSSSFVNSRSGGWGPVGQTTETVMGRKKRHERVHKRKATQRREQTSRQSTDGSYRDAQTTRQGKGKGGGTCTRDGSNM